MTIDSIITRRKTSNYASLQIVYEWEDVIAQMLKASFFEEGKWMQNRYLDHVPYLYDLLLLCGDKRTNEC